MKHSRHLFATAFFVLGLAPAFACNFDLSQAVLVVRAGELPNAEKTAATVLIAVIAIHIAAALKHLLIDKDGVFHRMLPGGRSA